MGWKYRTDLITSCCNGFIHSYIEFDCVISKVLISLLSSAESARITGCLRSSVNPPSHRWQHHIRRTIKRPIISDKPEINSVIDAVTVSVPRFLPNGELMQVRIIAGLGLFRCNRLCLTEISPHRPEIPQNQAYFQFQISS